MQRQKPALSAYITFAGGNAEAYLDPGPGFEGLDPYVLLLQFYAKSMYNLGPSKYAPQLRDFMWWAAEQAWPAATGNPTAAPVDISAGHFTMAPVGRSVKAGVGAFLELGRSGKYIQTEYQTPRGQEEYYAFLAVPVLFQHLLTGDKAWGDFMIPAIGVKVLSRKYSAGPSAWDSVPAILSDSQSALQQAMQAVADEMGRLGLI